jgi:hypothetical protein
MWLWLPERSEGGDAAAIVRRAKVSDITHLYVRTGSSVQGFYAQDFLNRLLPVAHAANIRVFGWDFPYLDNWIGDVDRATAAINYVTPDGHRIDGFTADIETRSEHVNITPDTGRNYGLWLRHQVGANYPLIATVPRPSPALVTYPFAEVVAPFDAIAPMVYWLQRDGAMEASATMAALLRFGKPIMPVGQAYDGLPEGGPPGVPRAADIQRFMKTAEDMGATAVSFWSWQAADQQAWDGIRDAPSFVVPAAPAPMSMGTVRAYQALLTSLGFPVTVTGVWDPPTALATKDYQKAAKLPLSAVIDEVTRDALLTPFAPPVQPMP